MRRSILGVFLLFASLSQASGQSAAPGKIALRPLAFNPTLRYHEAYAHDPAAPEDTVSIKLEINSYLNHEFTEVSLISRKVAFTTKPDRASLKRPGELIGEITLSDRTNSAILLFLPAPADGPTKARIMAIDDSKKEFPAGSIYVTNLSPDGVRLSLESNNYDLYPAKSLLIKDPPVREGGMSGMRAFVNRNDALQPLSTGLWPHPGVSRAVKVFFLNSSSGKIELRAFDDVPPREPFAITEPAP
jgi:hypothetical protein